MLRREHFLFQSLTHSYSLGTQEAARLAERIPVIHVHGQLGPLPWQSGSGKRPYDSECSPTIVEDCARKLRIIGEEDLDGGAEYQSARELLNRAEVVVFLGFGYHRINLERLQAERWQQDVTVFGTAFGLVEAERDRASKALRNGLKVGAATDRICELLRHRDAHFFRY